MSFDLGNWADQLRCEMCTGDPFGIPELLPEYLESGLPDDFWDEPPDAPDPFDLEIPDPHPTFERTSGGFIIGIEGSF